MAAKNGTIVQTLSGQEKLIGAGRTAGQQAVYQLATLGCSLGIAIVGGLVTGFILRLPIWDKVPDEELFLDHHNFEVPEEEANEKEGINGNFTSVF